MKLLIAYCSPASNHLSPLQAVTGLHKVVPVHKQRVMKKYEGG